MNSLWMMKKGEATCDQFDAFNVIYLDFSNDFFMNGDTNLGLISLYNVNYFLVHGTLCGWCSLFDYEYSGYRTCQASSVCEFLPLNCLICMQIGLVFVSI